jgi:hypothetical protein
MSRVRALGFTLFPAYFGTGARITSVARDWREIHVKVPLTLRTRNYVGTIYGGSMYGAVDPIYMIMLIKNLGEEYIVWDKAASIRFKKPGRCTLYARFTLTAEELDAIRTALEQVRSIDRMYSVDLIDASGAICATVEKTIYIRRTDAPPPTQTAPVAGQLKGTASARP